MSTALPDNWDSWTDLDEEVRLGAIHDPEFWSSLSEAQRERFLEQADWQEIRLVPAAKQAKLEALVSMDEICAHLGLDDVRVYWLMSTRKLPGYLVGGVWKFDRRQVEAWVEELGGVEAVRADVDDQIARHRAAASGDAAETQSQR